MFKTLGKHSRQVIDMSMQNGPYLEISWKWNLIHTLELKLWHFEVRIGKPCICNVSTHMLQEGWGYTLINMTTFTTLGQD